MPKNVLDKMDKIMVDETVILPDGSLGGMKYETFISVGAEVLESINKNIKEIEVIGRSK